MMSTKEKFYFETRELDENFKEYGGVKCCNVCFNEYNKKTMNIMVHGTKNEALLTQKRIFGKFFKDEEELIHCFGIKGKMKTNPDGSISTRYTMGIAMKPSYREFDYLNNVYKCVVKQLRCHLDARIELVENLIKKYDNDMGRVDNELNIIDSKRKNPYFFTNNYQELKLMKTYSDESLCRPIISKYYPKNDFTKEPRYGLHFNVEFNKNGKAKPTTFNRLSYNENGKLEIGELENPIDDLIGKGPFTIRHMKVGFGVFVMASNDSKEKVFMYKPKVMELLIDKYVTPETQDGYLIGKPIKSLQEEIRLENERKRKRKRDEDDEEDGYESPKKKMKLN